MDIAISESLWSMNAQVAESPLLTATDIYSATCIQLNATSSAAIAAAAAAVANAEMRGNFGRPFQILVFTSLLLTIIGIFLFCYWTSVVRPTPVPQTLISRCWYEQFQVLLISILASCKSWRAFLLCFCCCTHKHTLLMKWTWDDSQVSVLPLDRMLI